MITHGLAAPRNLEAARRAEAAVRAGGAEPATVAVMDGQLVVGLSDSQLETLASIQGARKASRATLALALVEEGWAGTTVSATMIAASLAGIRVFATGGIGGVHRGGASIDGHLRGPRRARADARAGRLRRAEVRARRGLDTGIPGDARRADRRLGTREMAGFFARESGRQLAGSVADAAAAARLATAHWDLGLETGLVVAVPVPAESALSRDEAESAIAQAMADSEAAGIHGPAATPFVLARVAELTNGRSVAANLALIENNARVAAEIATALAGMEPG